MSVAFQNRLRKMARHFDKWARRKNLDVYRIYDADLEEFPVTIDRYGDRLYVSLYAKKPLTDEEWGEQKVFYREMLLETFGASRDSVFFKLRHRAKGGSQYDKLAWVEREFLVEENGLSFRVNLTDYLDTGLFADHRVTRRMVGERSEGKKVLNLFAYTCSFSVYAAVGGGQTHSIDLSNTYLEWGKRNFTANEIDPNDHRFERADVKAWLSQAVSEQYDLIVLDPPTFSNSKSMSDVLDTQKDHVEMINQCLARLTDEGELFFSTNYRRFSLEEEGLASDKVKEITKQTNPPDYRKRLPHRCWIIGK